MVGANAAELDGSWATDIDTCEKIFVNRGGQNYLASDADIYGSGFVVTGNTIRGKIATCKISARKMIGSTIQLKTTCATDITIMNNNFELKFVDDNKLIRNVPGIPELSTPYYRCPKR